MEIDFPVALYEIYVVTLKNHVSRFHNGYLTIRELISIIPLKKITNLLDLFSN